MGWLPYVFDPVNNPGVADDTPLASAVYTNYLVWADFVQWDYPCTQPPQYHWDVINNLINAWAPKGRKIKIGIHIADPTAIGNRPHVPLCFLWSFPNSGNWYNSWEGNPIASTYAPYPGQNPGYDWKPNYSDPTFISYYQQFISALAAQYNATPGWQTSIESIDISTYGYWGEWHDGDFQWQSPNIQTTTLKSLVDQFITAFSGSAMGFTMNVIGATVNPSYNLETTDINAVKYAIQKGAGPVRRCIGICLNSITPYMSPDEQAVIQSAVANSPFQGEWGSWNGTIFNFYTASGALVGDTENAIHEALGLNSTYLGWYSSAGALQQTVSNQTETLENFFQRSAGYRFYVDATTYPLIANRAGSITLQQGWYQRGVAKLYQHFQLGAFLVANGTVIALHPVDSFGAELWPIGPSGRHEIDSTFTIPPGMPSGTYTLEFAVVDEFGAPAMNLAIGSKDTSGLTDSVNDYGKYVVGQIQIQ